MVKKRPLEPVVLAVRRHRKSTNEAKQNEMKLKGKHSEVMAKASNKKPSG